MLRKLFSLGMALVLGQVAVAQEYDDVYFSAKDRKTTVFTKNTSIFSSNRNENYRSDDPLSNRSNGSQDKFANPEYNGQNNANVANLPYYRKETANNAYFNSLYASPYSLSLFNNFNAFGANRYSYWADPMVSNYYGFNNFGYNYGCPTSMFSMGLGMGFNSFNSGGWGINSWNRWGMGYNSFWGNSFWGMNSWNRWNNWGNPTVITRNDPWGQRRGVYQGTRSNRSSDFSINQQQRTGRSGGRTEGWNYNSGTREQRSGSNSSNDRSSGYEQRRSTWGNNSGGRSESGSSWGSGSSGGGRSSGSSGGGGRSGGSGGGGGGGGRSGRGN